MQLNLPRGTIFIVASVVAGLVATFAIHRYVSIKTTIPVAATQQVIIAAGDISPGTALSSQTGQDRCLAPESDSAQIRVLYGRN